MLNAVIHFSIKNKFIVGLLTLALIVWGVWSATKLPVDAVPDITNNQVQIITICPTLAGQEVEQFVTYSIEKALANLPDVEEMRSISRFGLSVVTVVFTDEVNPWFARQLVGEKLKEAEEEIPPGIGKPELAPLSTGLGEIYQYVIHPKAGSEDKYDAMDLRTMQDWIVARQLYGTPGVAEVNSFGGILKQYEVAVSPDRLRAMNVTIPDIFRALQNNNENTGGAYIDKKPNAYFIRGIGLVTSLDDVRKIMVKTSAGGIPVLIGDVAEVRFGSAVRYGALTYNGEKEAVGGVVMMLKGANSAQVVELVKAKMATIQHSLPEDVVIEPFLDRTDLVTRAIATVERNLVEGALIVIFVLVLFLGNFRAGLIVASAIPLSMLFALGMMNVFGVSANLMSLGAIDFGLIVDGAVIIVEATMHAIGLRKQGDTHRLSQDEMDNAVEGSARKMMNSAAFGQIIILIVYIPILSLVGIEGKMFRPMAQTVGFAILGALLLSLTYIPMMSAQFLSKKVNHGKNISDRLMDFFQRLYSPVLNVAIRFKYAVVAATVALFAVSLWLFGRLGGEFIPQLQEGDYAFHCILPMGTSLSQSVETSMQAMRIIKSFPEVKMVVGKTGSAEVPTDPMPPEATDMIIILKPMDEWTTTKDYRELASLIEEKLEIIPGVFFETNQPIQMRFNELMTGIRQDVAVKIFGENIDTLAALAPKVANLVQTVNGTTTPQIEQTIGLPQITIEYDRSRLANYGVSVEDVNHTVSTAFAGEKAGVVFENERKFDLVVRLDSAHRASIDDVSELLVPTPSGNQIPLDQVATVAFKQGPAQISRDDGKRRIVVGFNVKGRDVQTVVQEIEQKLDKQVKLPAGYYYSFGGTFENLEKANARLAIAVPMALALIFLLLYFTFNALKPAALIYTAIPMSAIGGVFALLLRDMPFSISAGVGFIALFGVAVLNGIVLIATFNQLEKDGMENVIDRVVEGTKIRLRPVLMTATVASLGFLPMALSTGAGAEVQKPLATVVIGGLISATFLTLVVLPLLYIIFTKHKNKGENMAAVVSVVFLLTFFGQNAAAQTGSTLQRLTLEEAVSKAKSNNPQLKAGTYQIQALQALRPAAYEVPKTNFELQMGQYNSNRFDQSIGIRQEIPNPRNKRAGLALNEANLSSAELSLSVKENGLVSEVRSVWYELAYLLEKHRLLESQDSLLAQFVKAADLRLRTGESSGLEQATAASQSGELRNQLAQVQADIEIAQSQLQTLLATKEPVGIPADTRIEKLELVLDGNVSGNPALAWYQQQIAVSEAKLEVEKARRAPDFSIGYLNQSLTTPEGSDPRYTAADRFHIVQAGVALPIFDKAQKVRIQSAELEWKATQANVESQINQLEGQARQALLAYEKQRRTLDYFEQTALPNADLLLSTAQTAFRAGSIDYVEYVQALTRAHTIRLNYLDALNQQNQAAVQYQYFVNQ